MIAVADRTAERHLGAGCVHAKVAGAAIIATGWEQVIGRRQLFCFMATRLFLPLLSRIIEPSMQLAVCNRTPALQLSRRPCHRSPQPVCGYPHKFGLMKEYTQLADPPPQNLQNRADRAVCLRSSLDDNVVRSPVSGNPRAELGRSAAKACKSRGESQPGRQLVRDTSRATNSYSSRVVIASRLS